MDVRKYVLYRFDRWWRWIENEDENLEEGRVHESRMLPSDLRFVITNLIWGGTWACDVTCGGGGALQPRYVPMCHGDIVPPDGVAVGKVLVRGVVGH